LGRKYSGLKPDLAAQKAGASNLPAGEAELVFTTSEGPVVITTRDKLVFVAESFPLETARKLTALILDAQGSGEMRMAQSPQPATLRAPTLRLVSVARVGDHDATDQTRPLTADLVRFMSSCGVMKAAVEGAIQAGR